MYTVPQNNPTVTATTQQMCQQIQNNNLPLPAVCAPYSRDCKIAKTRHRLISSMVSLGSASALAVATHYGTKSAGWTIAAFLVAGTLANVTYRAAHPYGEYPAACDPASQKQ